MEENPDDLAHDAAALGKAGVPAVEAVFREIAQLTKGAYCRFDPGAAQQLGQLLRAVAVYATGGMAALESRTDAGAVKLLAQLR